MIRGKIQFVQFGEVLPKLYSHIGGILYMVYFDKSQ